MKHDYWPITNFVNWYLSWLNECTWNRLLLQWYPKGQVGGHSIKVCRFRQVSPHPFVPFAFILQSHSSIPLISLLMGVLHKNLSLSICSKEFNLSLIWFCVCLVIMYFLNFLWIRLKIPFISLICSFCHFLFVQANFYCFYFT